MSSTTSTPYRHAGYYIVGLLLLAFIGFWPSYFSKILNGTGDYNTYFHFHGVMAVLWILMLIIQPTLIRQKKYQLHRRMGTIGHVLMGLFYLSVILLAHYQESRAGAPHYIGVFIPFKDLLVISVSYFIAMKYRKVTSIHARAMIGTGIVFIEPALIRAISFLFPNIEYPYRWTIAIVYLILIALIIGGRHSKKGRWVFPLILGMYIIIHSIIMFRIPMALFDRGAAWFLGLPLT